MIPAGEKVFLASHPVDFRKGSDSLLSLVRDAGSDPFNGSHFVFRAKGGRAGQDRPVGWIRGLRLLEAAGESAVLLAADRP